MNNFNDKVSFIWSVADLLRGPYNPAQIQAISRIYGEFAVGEYSKIFDNEDFGFW
jgi:hypothetical protein